MIKTKIKTVVLAASLLFAVTHSQANMLDNIVDAANSALPSYGRADAPSQRTDLTASDVKDALRELLTIGSTGVVSRLQKYGYADPVVRIELPKRWNKAKKLAARIGYSRKFDELEQRLATAAVAAAPAIRDLVQEMISELRLDNPRSLLHGEEATATRQLRIQIGEHLAHRLHPIINQELKSAGALNASTEIARRVKHLPMVKLHETDFTDHVVAESLDGFFHYLAEEERAVRSQPARQTSTLLRRVFG